MVSVKVDVQENSYDIVIGDQSLKDLGAALKPLALGTDAVIVTNPVIKKYHGRALAQTLKQNGFSVLFLEVPSGEKSKSATTAFKLIDKIAAYNVRRKIFVVAFGGGVVGDLAGFVAAVYKRGIPCVQVATTLLAQVDSAIGGKVAIDLPVGKNLIGAFYQPKIVWSDVGVLATLDKRQIRNGLAEVVKYGIISDRNLFDYVEQNVQKLLSVDSKTMSEVVLACSKIKARIVSKDEKETKGVRTILNFGHTVGHAIEAADGYRRFHHGEAVGLGMRVAADISRRMGLLKTAEVERVNKILSLLGLPEKIKSVRLADIMRHMEHDKKFNAARNRFVLATSIGSVKVVEGIKRSIIQSAIKAQM